MLVAVVLLKFLMYKIVVALITSEKHFILKEILILETP